MSRIGDIMRARARCWAFTGSCLDKSTCVGCIVYEDIKKGNEKDGNSREK